MTQNQRRTGYVYEELYLWHDAGSISYGRQWVQPGEAWENPETKGRLHSLLSATGLVDKLIRIRARNATKEEILRFHTLAHHDRIKESSDARGGDGDFAQFGHGSYEIAMLSVGGVLSAVEAMLIDKTIDNAYCLVRPPGHHAVADQAMGFCLFNNVALAALHARSLSVGVQRIAIVDYDVHHGNGTQDCFWNDPDTLFISIHQDNNYPSGTGTLKETGGPDAPGATINIPLPPGSGVGAYKYAFEHCVIPAVEKFQPDMIFVSSGFDASYVDPLARMMVSSQCFGWMASQLQSLADKLCQGKIIFSHEGGYSKEYVPFCGLAVIEAISGITTGVTDPSLDEVHGWGYQECLPHQAAVVDAAAALAGVAQGTSLDSGWLSDQGWTETERTVMREMRQILDDQILDPTRKQAILHEIMNQHKC